MSALVLLPRLAPSAVQPCADEQVRIREALRARERQQSAVARLGQRALACSEELQPLFDDTVATVADVLGADYCKVLELSPDGNRLFLRAGFGWRPGLVGTVWIDALERSQAGWTLASNAPVIVEELAADTRFAGPELLLSHGVVSGVSCLIAGPPGGRPWGVLGVHTRTRRAFDDDDVSFVTAVANVLAALIERRRTENALREADRRKDIFLATLSHELRNPLAPLRSGIEILRLAGDDPEIAAQALAAMDRQLAQLVHLVDDLLDVSRIDRGKIRLRRQRVELAEILSNALEAARPAIAARGHRLELDLAGGSIPLDGDPARLAQVLTNLLGNAAKYTEPGGCITVATGTVTGGHDGDWAQVAVRDTGVGIVPESLPGLFELFAQEREAQAMSEGGLGLGLHIARRIAELHGGSVEAHSTGRGQGSTFVVRLPLAGPAAPAAVQGPPSALAPDAAPPRRILVVDDNRDVADSTALLVSLMGHETRTAYSGLAALEEGPEFRPEVVVMDLGMPEPNGWETAARIRREPWGEHAVLVAFTGWGQEEDLRRTRAAGFDRHLVKPVDLAALKALLADIRQP